MKKTRIFAKILSVALTLCMLSTAFPVSVFADEVEAYPLWVGSVQINSENCADIPSVTDGKASYDPASHTLTLDSVKGIDGETYDAKVYSREDLSVVIKGENSFNADASEDWYDNNKGFYAQGDLAFSDGGSGRLTLNGFDCFVNNYSYRRVTIESGVYSFYKASYQSGEFGSYAFDCGDLTINGGSISIENADGVCASNFLMTGGSLTMNNYSDGITADYLTISGGEINMLEGRAGHGIYAIESASVGGTDTLIYVEHNNIALYTYSSNFTLSNEVAITKPTGGYLGTWYGMPAIANENGSGATVAKIGSYKTSVWLNGDGSELDRADYIKGQIKPETALVPTKTEDDDNYYTFEKWDEGTVNGSVTVYEPIFKSTAKKHTVTIDLGALGEPITVKVKHGDRFFDAMDEAGVFELLDDIETADHIFRDLATKPLSEFANEDEYGEDAWALLDTTVEDDMTVYAGFYQKIKAVTLTIGRPVIGTEVRITDDVQTPAPQFTVPEGVHYRLEDDYGSLNWEDPENLGYFFEGVFEEGKTYNTTALLVADFGYWLDEDTVVTVKGGEVVEAYGRMSLVVVVSTTPMKPLILGDINCDGIVDINDATAIQYHLAELELIDEAYHAAGDINRNGMLDINDVTEIQKYLAELSANPLIGTTI